MAARSYIRAMGLNGVYNEVDEYMAGQVVFVAGNAIPTGYLECNGATVSRATYATLFSAIGSIYGPGDGATTFHLPDLRGEFLRGADKGRGVDSGRAVGSFQGDANKKHNHMMNAASPGDGGANGAMAGSMWVLKFASTVQLPGSTGDATALNEGGGAPEARPRNIAMTACIKY